MRINFSKFFNAVSNLKNWQEYSFHKREVQERMLHFVTRPNEIKLEVDAGNYSVFKEIFVEDFYRIKEIINKLPSNGVVVDIGANEGFFAALILSKKKDATVYAYEPLPYNLKKINKLRQINPSFADKIILHDEAVADGSSETIRLFMQQENNESSIASIYKEFDERNTKSIDVPATTIAKIIADNNLNKIHLLKLDCEGAEYAILYSAEASVLKKIKCILIEVHPLDNEKRNEKYLADFLSGNGFHIKTTVFNNGCYYMIATQ
jgi:FkbM family methyltransferase